VVSKGVFMLHRSIIRFYHSWLRWYPFDFRVEYSAGMEHTFVERLQEACDRRSRAAVVTLVVREAWNVFATALVERVTAMIRVMRRRGRTSPGLTPGNHPAGKHWAELVASAVQDIRYAFRSLVRSLGFSTTAVLTLALGIGANTAIFSVVNGVLLRPLPYENPERLIQAWEIEPPGLGFGFSPPNFVSFRQEATLFEDMTAFLNTSFTLTGSGEPERVSGMLVSAGFFELLGVSLPDGRSFLQEEDMTGAEPVVILGHGFWQRRFGGNEAVLGTAITLSGVSRTVVGITPPTFRFGPGTIDVWAPLAFSHRDMSGRGRHFLDVLARLRPGIEFDAAAQELDAIAARLGNAYPETNAGWGVRAVPLLEMTVWRVRTPLLVLLGAVGFVLLIACANVVNLLLARAEGRGREMAVRAALGAGRSRLLRLLLSESIVLASLGGALGLGLAYAGVELLMTGIGSELPRATEVGLDIPALAFTMLVTLGAGILVGSVPAWQGARKNLLSGLREGGHQALQGVGRRRIRSVLVVAEVSLSLVLVMGAGLLLESFWRLTHVDSGFDHRQVLTGQISLPTSQYETDAQRGIFFADLVDEIERLPGVASAAATTGLPLLGGRNTTITVPGRPDEEYRGIDRRRITPGYFNTMRIPLLAGRFLNDRDKPDSPHVVIVNETLARRVFSDERAVGRQINWGGPWGPETLEIVGVVADVKQHGLDIDAFPTMYLAHAQIYAAESMSLAIRIAGDPLDAVAAVREAVWRLDPNLPLYRVATMEQVIADSVTSERFSMLLLGFFATVALSLAVVGIYGVMSYTVCERTQEMGVRIALGAGRREVLGLVIRQGMKLAFVGLILGIAGALGLGRVLSSLLYEVSARDPWTLASVAVLVAAVAAVACYLPARHAARVDPAEALRYE
jgi:putative ABC transport system permease protein